MYRSAPLPSRGKLKASASNSLRDLRGVDVYINPPRPSNPSGPVHQPPLPTSGCCFYAASGSAVNKHQEVRRVPGQTGRRGARATSCSRVDRRTPGASLRLKPKVENNLITRTCTVP